MRVYFVAAPCGSGKTHQFINLACKWANNGRRIIIVLPTKDLIDKTIEHFLHNRPDAPPYRKFHGDVVSDSVARELIDHLTRTDGKGQIVFATHAILPYLPNLSVRKFWHCFVDEAPQVFQHFSYDVPTAEVADPHELITDLITLEPYNSDYSRAKIKKRKRATMGRIAKDQKAEKTTREVAQALLNKHWQSFVDTRSHRKLKDGSTSQLSFFSMLMPTVLDGFASVTMASANFHDTFVYQLWRHLGVEFSEDTELASSLRFGQHENGHLITIKYADEKNWSRYRRLSPLNPDTDENTTIQDAIVEAIKSNFHDRPFVWQANKRVSYQLFDGNGQRLPNVPHGLNTYSHINNIAFLSSLNPHPEVFPFLRTMKLTTEAIRRAIYYQTGYQSVMRTSIRDPNNQDPKTIIVPDRSLAEYLHELFPGSKIEKLETRIPHDQPPTKLGRPRKYQDDKERKAVYQQRQKQKILNDLFSLQTVPYGSSQLEDERTQTRIDDEKAIRVLYSNFVPDPLTISIYRDKYASVPAGYVHWDNVEVFISDLKSWHLRTLRNKESNFLISPAIFDPDHPNRDGNKRRGRNNIRYLQHIWLDFDDGDLKPEEIERLFPHNRLVVFNTYNHTPDHPRFRVVFLTNRQLTPEVHEIVWDNIVAKLEEAGYSVWNKKRRGSNSRPSGLDISKRTPTSLFYAPCQAGVPSGSFFLDYSGPDRQLLDPVIGVENNVKAFPVPLVAKNPSGYDQVDQAKVEAATEKWRRSIHFPGEGNDRFFAYAVELRTTGMNLADIESKLIEGARFGRSPKERREQIPSIIASLRQSRRRAG